MGKMSSVRKVKRKDTTMGFKECSVNLETPYTTYCGEIKAYIEI